MMGYESGSSANAVLFMFPFVKSECKEDNSSETQSYIHHAQKSLILIEENH